MDYEQAMRALREADRRAQAGDEQAARDARRLAQIAQGLAPPNREPALSQANLGIADAVGGLVDLINPFDTPAVSQALGLGDTLTTGSAREGLVRGMQRIGAAGEDRPPEGLGEAFLRGGGQAAGSMVPATMGVNALRSLPGTAGAVADDLYRGMTTRAAPAMEVTAGGVSGAAERAAEDAGAPEWVQGVAAVAAPAVALPAATYAATRGPGRLPMVRAGSRAVDMVTSTLAPYTRRGAEAVARGRMNDLAGSRERAMQMGEGIDPQSPLTPAQQTGDDRMIALEQLARRQSPELDQRLSDRRNQTVDASRREIEGMGGDVRDAQTFLGERRAAFTTELRQRAQEAIQRAEERLSRVSADRRPSENSTIVMDEIEGARQTALQRERELWFAVPRERAVGVENARAVAERILSETGDELRTDIHPSIFRRLLDDETAYAGSTNVQNLHALYSRLRQVARERSAGPAPNNNAARIASEVADAILEDMAAAGIREIDEARLFSRALHETFDRGAFERLSRQTVQGDTVVDGRVALDRSVGRGGTGAMTDAENLEGAAAGLTPSGAPAPPNPRARGAIVDYIRGQFEAAGFTPDAQGRTVVNPRGAAQFIRGNRELLERYPELRAEILDAGRQRLDAQEFSDALARRLETLEDARRSATAGFIDATEERAVRAIIDAENPARAVQAILNSARRDPSGQAVEGVKAVFSDELIRRALGTQGGRTTLNADTMTSLLQDGRFRSAMSRVFTAGEIRRIERIVDTVRAVQGADAPRGSVGESLSGAQAPRFIQILVRIAGAQAASRSPMASGGGAGVGLQAAQMGSGAARDIADSLTADRASQILMDAIENPRLFQSLLMDPASPRFEREAVSRFVPYLVGTTAAQIEE